MKVEVCLTPALIDQHELAGKTVVVIDIFRATSCMVTGLNHGVRAIYPVATVEECLSLGKEGMVMAGERGGKKVAEFDIGNSPFEYMSERVQGREVAVSTTNGTLAISKSAAAAEILIGAFLNLSVTVQCLQEKGRDLVLHCAGWKGTPNLEDTLYAGAVIDKLQDTQLVNDSAALALSLLRHHQSDLLTAGKASGHAKRLAGFGVEKDIAFCMEMDRYTKVVAQEGKVVKVVQ